MRLILWLLILIFVLITLLSVEGFNIKKAVKTVSKSASKIADKAVDNIVKISTTAYKAVAVGTTGLLGINTSNNNKSPPPPPVPLPPPPPPTCISTSYNGRWFRVRNVKPGRAPSMTNNDIRCNFGQFPPSTKLAECINSVNPSMFPTHLIKQNTNATSLPLDDDPNSKYFLAYPSNVVGPNDPCKWTYMKYTNEQPNLITNTLVPDIPEESLESE